MSAASVRPRSAADCLIRSAVDISHPRQQGNPPASSSDASGPVRSDIINGLGAGAVGGGGNPSLVSSMPPGVVPGPVDSASATPSSGHGNYLPTQSQASYHSASSSPSARRLSSGFDGVNEEANIRANAAVVEGHANVCASAVMTVDNHDDANDGNCDDTLSEILGASSKVAPSLDLDLAFGTVDFNVEPACTPLLSPLSSLPPPLASPPPSAAAGVETRFFPRFYCCPRSPKMMTFYCFILLVPALCGKQGVNPPTGFDVYLSFTTRQI